jgi:hypothetical protein
MSCLAGTLTAEIARHPFETRQQDDDREQPGRGLQIESRNALRKVADESHRENYYGEHLLGYSERKQMNR